jgi:hypothetical protein
MRILLFLTMVLPLVFFCNSQSNKCKYLQVFLMGTFRDDSISIETEIGSVYFKRISTDLSTGQAHSVLLEFKTANSTIKVRDVINRNFDSVKYDGSYPYLYIYYQKPKIIFNYSKDLLMLE